VCFEVKFVLGGVAPQNALGSVLDARQQGAQWFLLPLVLDEGLACVHADWLRRYFFCRFDLFLSQKFDLVPRELEALFSNWVIQDVLEFIHNVCPLRLPCCVH